MEKKEYLVGVTIIEGRNFKGKDSSGTSDPFIKISCANLTPQVSMKKYKANTVVWNQSFTFSELFMNQYELETFELIIEAFDYNALSSNELIGYHSIGLSTLYRNLNHEFYKVWLTLFHPDFPNEPQGYLQVSCFIVGQNERPPAHAQDEDPLGDEEQVDEEAMAGLSEEKKIQIMKKKQGIFVLQDPQMIKKAYQLSINVIKAEGLPQCDSSGACNSFVSVRAVGAVQTTKVVEENYNPMYNARICFPIRIPILNDKITVRMWSQGRRGADVFIANIPEYPSPYDYFNVSKLLSNDGKMKSTWFNLYGIHPNERSWFQSKNAVKKEGSWYLGRVLISMQMAPNEKPQLLTTMAQPIKEPPSQKFQLWVDTYDLVNCDEANGNKVWIVATIGSYQSQKHEAKYRESTKSYTWKKISVKTMSVDFPIDPKQVPDIIINVYSEKTFTGEYRLGYIRIPARDCSRRNPQPQWYRLKSPLNDKTCPGIILMNIQYLWEGTNIERFPKQRSVEGSYKLYAQVLSGFELAPTYKEESLNTKVDIRIGNASLKDELSTEAMPGRYPVWNKLKIKNIVLDKNLQFASDMRVMLFNCSKSLILRREQWDVVGEFCVPLTSISKKLYPKPQFFNIIDSEGQFQGSVLARFFLKGIDEKRKKDDDAAILEEFNQITRIAFKANVKVSLFGIRNLIYFAKRPIVTLRLTNDPLKRQEVIKFEEPFDTRNPNFGKIIVFKDVELPFEPLLWPQLEVTVKDEGNMFGLGGCEWCYMTTPIFQYANFIREEDIKFALVQLNKNQNRITLVQKQIDPTKFFLQAQRDENLKDHLDKVNESDERYNQDSDGDDLDDTDYGVNMVGGMKIKEFDQSLDNFFDDQNDDDDDEDDDEVDAKDIQLQLKRDVNLNKKDSSVHDSTSPVKDKKKKQKALTINQEGAVVDVNNIIEITCTPQMKQEEERIRNHKIAELQKKIDQVSIQIQWTQNKKMKEKKSLELLELKNKIQELQDERMNEHKFWGYVMDDQQEEFQYGREVIREGQFEKFLQLPYQEFPLFTNTMFGGKTVQVGGMLKSGMLTGATLKAAINVVRVDSDSEDDSDSDEEVHGKSYITPGNPDDIDEKEGTVSAGRKGEEDKELAILKKIAEKYPFDLSKEKFMRSLLTNTQHFKVRVYLLTCQNLSAIDSYVDLKSKLAGMQALCSADPFPVIIVGDGVNNKQEQTVKYVNDRDKEIKQDLNPKFFRTYEFDASFPEDWKIEVQILDKGRLSYTDALIGSTTIDLEDRYYGNFRKQILDGLELYKEMVQMEIIAEDRKEIPNKQYILERKKKIDELVKEINSVKAIEQKPMPVEFRELRHPNKKQAQGMVEMWVEVLTLEEARRTPMARLQVQQKEEYELRLIIWETMDVPLVNGESVDIYCKVFYDPNGWSGNEIEKATDVHYGSKDGRGVFNYRFKFDIEVPCDFPRLKFQIYDYGLLNDEAIGEAILDLKQTMALLRKEGRLDISKIQLQFNHPNKKNDNCGSLLISMAILPKQEAESQPVGEGWDEPNINPKLTPPTEGRGVGNKIMTITNIDVGSLKIPKFNMFRKFLIFGVIVAIIIIVLIFIMRKNEAFEETKKKMKQIEEELEALESEDSEYETMKKNRNQKRLFNDQQWKIIVGIGGSGILIAMIYLTLNMVEQLLSGGQA